MCIKQFDTKFYDYVHELLHQYIVDVWRRMTHHWAWLQMTQHRLQTTQYRLQTTQPTSGGAVTAVINCCANYVEASSPQQWGPIYRFFGQAGHAGPMDGCRCFSQKQVMSRLIQVRQHLTSESGFAISVRKQISIRCNRIEHWVQFKCAGIRQAQYTVTWTCHIHIYKPTHTDITPPPHPSRPWSKPPTHSPPTPPTPPQPNHRHTSNIPLCSLRIGKAQTQSSYPLTPSPLTPPRAKHIHISHTSPTPLISRTTVIHNTSAALDTLPVKTISQQIMSLGLSLHQ